MEDIVRNNRTASYYIWISILLSVILIGLYSVLMSFVEGMELLEFNLLIPWSMLISTYVFFVVSSTGICIVTSLAHVFGMKRYELIGKRGVFLAVITIVFGMIAIMLHLGHPERAMIYTILTPNIHSAMSLMSFFYSLYIPSIIVLYWLLSRADFARLTNSSAGWRRRFYGLMTLGIKSESPESIKRDANLARITGIIAVTTGLSAMAVEGSLFGHAEAMPYWYGAYYPVYLLLSATFSGLAWLLFITIITYKIKMEEMSEELKKLMFEMSKILALLLSVGLLFMSYKMGFGILDDIKTKTIMMFTKGSLSVSFWVFEIAIGTLIPIFILSYSANKKSLNGVLMASIMVIAGLFVSKYDFTVAGQVYPVFKDKVPSLFPALMEIFVVAGIISAFFLAYTLAVRFLPMQETEQ
ncbi:MAG: polysulfide reductase NrfD [Thermodesulfovibrionales bacterium]|nr:polysulfide reductase NrfD [Thermodesulfovibrionales bacterium]